MSTNNFTLPNGPLKWFSNPKDFSGDNNLGIYATEATQRYVYGTRYITWDGRVYRYTYASAAVYSYHGAASLADGVLAYTANPTATSAGATTVIATLASRSEDDLAGGYFVVFDNSGTDTTYMMGIVGNDATSGSTTQIYLDNPLPIATTTSDYHEVFENPFSESSAATNGYAAWLGVPAQTAAATYKYWCQTWGPAYISGGESIDSPTSDYRCIRWGSNAALYTEASKANGQIAGYILNEGSSSIAGPMIYLMCSC
jgi:hypothetical protein